jgi:hypothetical protein
LIHHHRLLKIQQLVAFQPVVQHREADPYGELTDQQ